MKKTLILFTLVLLLTIPAVFAVGDVAYIVKDSLGADSYLITELHNLDLTVDTIYEPNVLSTNFSLYRLIIIGDQNLDNPSNIPIDKHRSMVISSYDFYRQSTDYQLGWSYSKGSVTSPTRIYRTTYQTSIFDGLPDSFYAYSISSPNIQTVYLGGTKATGSRTLMHSGSTSEAVLSIVEPGSKFLNGRNATQRGIFFGITKPQY